jgi:hypothetical protein
MKPLRLIAIAIEGILAWALPIGAEAAGQAAPATRPVVVELYQSQGCSDCPPAQDYLNRLADRPDVLALSFGVTYWDYLGWQDSFASPQFTRRQREYAARGNGEVATPQYWINGQTTVLGANPRRVAQVIAESGRADGPAISLSAARLSIGPGQAPRGGADVWLVHYDPRTIQVAVRAGENGGRTLPHRDMVRELTKIGRWNGSPLSIAVRQPADPSWKTAILVQAGAGGRILAAAKG